MDTTENKQYTKKPYPEFKPEKAGEYLTNNGEFTWHPEYGGAWYLKGFKESDTTVKWFFEPSPMEVKEPEAKYIWREGRQLGNVTLEDAKKILSPSYVCFKGNSKWKIKDESERRIYRELYPALYGALPSGYGRKDRSQKGPLGYSHPEDT